MTRKEYCVQHTKYKFPFLCMVTCLYSVFMKTPNVPIRKQTRLEIPAIKTFTAYCFSSAASNNLNCAFPNAVAIKKIEVFF